MVVLGATIFFIFRGNKFKRESERLARQQESGEYKALKEQVEDLRKLKGNLENQVQLSKVELANLKMLRDEAEAQITSAKTQFKDWNEAAKAAEERVKVKETELTKLKEEGSKQVNAEVEKERTEGHKLLAAEAEAERAKATAELQAAVAALRTELDGLEKRRVVATGDLEELTKRKVELEGVTSHLAQCHADALRRVALESDGGGRIRLGEGDKKDAELLVRTARGMKCENAVRKATYDVYVKPEIERVVRELGVSGVSGIYRIWRVVDGKDLSYVGQAVDVGERWKTHAKRAWGVDNTGRIVLYQAMMESGIEEWHWELLEEVKESKSGSGAEGVTLSERECYWGGFYGVKEVGLNKKLG